jgi:hypothetical protein
MNLDGFLNFNTAPRASPPPDPIDWEARADRLNEHLRPRAENLVRQLLPAARPAGSEMRIGSLAGEPGESMSIEVSGEKAGVWIDHHTRETGNLIQMWMRLEDRGFAEACEDLEGWSGLGPPRDLVDRRAVIRAREHAARPREALEGRWETVAHYPYTNGAGELVATVHRQEHTHQLTAEGKRKKKFLQQLPDGTWNGPKGLRPLYRLQEIKDAMAVVLVEGEKCVHALAEAGIPATTAMGGAGAAPDLTDWRPLAGKRVIIWPDNDEAGATLAVRVRPVLEALGCVVTSIEIPQGKTAKWDAADAVAEGLDVVAILRRTVSEPAPQVTTRRLNPMSYRQARQAPEPTWLIEDVLPEKSLGLLWGVYGALKSFIALDKALHLATGRPWHGKAVERTRVMYVAGEGQAGLTKRVTGWLKARGLTEEDIEGWFFMEGTLTSLVEQADELIEVCQELGIGMLVVDTVAQTFGAGDENSQRDANAYLGAGKKVARGADATLLWVHHAGKDSERGPRGSSVIPAGVDVAMKVSKKGALGAKLSCQGLGTKMKDAEPFPDILFAASQIEVGVDRKGKPVNTLVLTAGDGHRIEISDEERGGAERTGVREGQLGSTQQRVLSHLRERALAGQPPMSLTEIHRELGGDNGNLSRTLRSLFDLGLIRDYGEPGARRWGVA